MWGAEESEELSCQEGEGDEAGLGLADSCGLQVCAPACSLFLDLRTAGLGFLLLHVTASVHEHEGWQR